MLLLTLVANEFHTSMCSVSLFLAQSSTQEIVICIMCFSFYLVKSKINRTISSNFYSLFGLNLKNIAPPFLEL